MTDSDGLLVERGELGRVETAVSQYQQARTDGLCHEGALEIALAEIKSQLVVELVEKAIAQQIENDRLY